MNKYNAPYLEKYSGRYSRYKCPSCGDQHSLVRYIDGNTGKHIAPHVGRCNHESSCSYHYTPKQFYEDNPQRKGVAAIIPSDAPSKLRRIKSQEPDTIPDKYLINSLGYNSHFATFLHSIFDSDTVMRLVNDYYLGWSKDYAVIFWQIDSNMQVRTGKIMQYNPTTGKRVKDSPGAINWMHASLRKSGVLTEDYNLVQCLFGEHLLSRYPDKAVALVESEKSAIIGAGVFSEYIWLATGGKSQLSIEKLKVLKDRTVIMFPDIDGYDKWSRKAEELQAMGCNVLISDVLEQFSTPEDYEAKIDIADWLVKDLCN